MVGGEINIPSSLRIIENYSYGYFANIDSLKFEEGIIEIKDEAFAYSTAISYVIFPKTLTNIGTNIFTMCQALSAIYYRGTQAECNIVRKDTSLTVPVYYYSETEPTAEGNYWHELDGEPVEW